MARLSGKEHPVTKMPVQPANTTHGYLPFMQKFVILSSHYHN